MHAYCRLFVLIDSSWADFMHTYSVLCRLFADLMHISCRVNGFQMQHRDRRGPIAPFFEGKGAEVAVLWPPVAPTTGAYAPGRSGPRGRRGAPPPGSGGCCRPIERSDSGGRRHLRERSAASFSTSSIRYRRRRLRGLQACARRGGAEGGAARATGAAAGEGPAGEGPATAASNGKEPIDGSPSAPPSAPPSTAPSAPP